MASVFAMAMMLEHAFAALGKPSYPRVIVVAVVVSEEVLALVAWVL